jgi:subtilisin-like proprotein convertase family protein
VKQLLEQTADQDLSLVTDTTVNADGAFNGAGFSLWFGHGKVNASAAVRAAAGGIAADRIVDVEQEANLDIPDLGGSVAGAIWVEEPGTITDFRVRVDISHTFIGDLRVDLIAPDGTAVTLHNNTGGSADNLVRTYSVQETPALRSLLGKPVQGAWGLRVMDTFRFDVGRLNRWRIVARAAASSPTPSGPTRVGDVVARAPGACAPAPAEGDTIHGGAGGVGQHRGGPCCVVTVWSRAGARPRPA